MMKHVICIIQGFELALFRMNTLVVIRFGPESGNCPERRLGTCFLRFSIVGQPSLFEGLAFVWGAAYHPVRMARALMPRHLHNVGMGKRFFRRLDLSGVFSVFWDVPPIFSKLIGIQSQPMFFKACRYILGHAANCLMDSDVPLRVT